MFFRPSAASRLPPRHTLATMRHRPIKPPFTEPNFMPLNITNGEDRFQQGVILQNAGRIEEARRCYLEVLNVNPNHSKALQNLGIIELSAGRTDAALPLLTRSITIDPNDADAYNTLGEIYRARLLGTQAIASFDK